MIEHDDIFFLPILKSMAYIVISVIAFVFIIALLFAFIIFLGI